MSQPRHQRQLINELREVFTIVRELVSDNHVMLNSIDDIYEDEVLRETMLIPQQYDVDILDALAAVRAVVSNINFIAICASVGGRFDTIRFNTNTFETFVQVLEAITMSSTDRARIKNMVAKYKPLLACVDYLLSEPMRLVRRVAQIQRLGSNDVNIL